MVDVKMYTRDGCRGGRENFKWDQIKEQDFKDREQYLGSSMKVGLMAKFGRYYVHDWYARKRDTAESIEDERQTVQQYEEELMQEALGLKPKKLLLAKKQLSQEELNEFLKKDSEKGADKQGREVMGPQRQTVTDGQGREVDAVELYGDSRISGLGFAAHRNAKLEKYKSDILGTESKLEGIKGEPIKLEMKREVKDEPMTDTEVMRLGHSQSAASSSTDGFKKEEGKEDVLKAEVKDEPTAPQAEASALKRRIDDLEDEAKHKSKNEGKHKSDKKSKKKDKKAEKKAKKKIKKAAKKLKKAAKHVAKADPRSSRRATSHSDSSSSSSS